MFPDYENVHCRDPSSFPINCSNSSSLQGSEQILMSTIKKTQVSVKGFSTQGQESFGISPPPPLPTSKLIICYIYMYIIIILKRPTSSLLPIPIPTLIFNITRRKGGRSGRFGDVRMMSHGRGLNWPGYGLDFLVTLHLLLTHARTCALALQCKRMDNRIDLQTCLVGTLRFARTKQKALPESEWRCFGESETSTSG